MCGGGGVVFVLFVGGCSVCSFFLIFCFSLCSGFSSLCCFVCHHAVEGVFVVVLVNHRGGVYLQFGSSLPCGHGGVFPLDLVEKPLIKPIDGKDFLDRVLSDLAVCLIVVVRVRVSCFCGCSLQSGLASLVGPAFSTETAERGAPDENLGVVGGEV